jgi:hypothetical protein
VVFLDHSPTHGGDALRTYLRTPDLRIHLVRLPAYSPDFNADEAIWDWAHAEVTANTCLGTKAAVRERVDSFFASLQQRKEEVKRRCRSALQAEATALAAVEFSLRYQYRYRPTGGTRTHAMPGEPVIME